MRKFLTASFFVFLLFSVGSAQTDKKETKEKPVPAGLGNGNGDGYGTGSGSTTPAKTPNYTPKADELVKIISKPRAEYTDQARAKMVEGKVVLEITFLKTGTIGKIKVVSGLPDGLTQQSVEAAKRIRFEPARKKGKPITVTKKIEYTFTVY